MGDDGIYASTADVQAKAGINANVTLSAEAYINIFVAMAESFINVATRKVWAATTAEFALLGAGVRNLLRDAASNLAALYVINGDMSGFSSRAEVQTMLDVLDSRTNDIIKLLKDEIYVSFISGA